MKVCEVIDLPCSHRPTVKGCLFCCLNSGQLCLSRNAFFTSVTKLMHIVISIPLIILMSVVMIPLLFMIAFIYFLDYSSHPFSNFAYMFKEPDFDGFISITFVFFYIGFSLRIVIYCFHFEFYPPTPPVLNLMSVTLDSYFLV